MNATEKEKIRLNITEAEEKKLRLDKCEIRLNYYFEKHGVKTKVVFSDWQTICLVAAEIFIKLYAAKKKGEKITLNVFGLGEVAEPEVKLNY